ncbi:MAG: hypothetical protein GW938_16885 [Leptospira sp.]|nr:hypothetical protein [Leptospira sp.]NCS95287.1 hypothetical protein [Leptospira sp.]
MEIGSQNVHSAHPMAVQSSIRTEMQVQDRGPDSIPPISSANYSAETNTQVDNTKSSGRYLDTKA